MVDLATRYLGLELKNPLIASASPLTGDLGKIRALEDAGAAAVVLPSLFEEQIEQENEHLQQFVNEHAESFAEALSYFPSPTQNHSAVDAYLELVRRARQAVDIPVIASLNGINVAGWTHYARLLEDAGASAIELNIFLVPTNMALDGPDVERRHIDILAAVKGATSVPVAVKLNPYFSALGPVAAGLVSAGADGLVLFNRFYQPDINLEKMTFELDLDLSSPAEIRLPLLWLTQLARRVNASLAASTGVETVDEVVKYLLAGADVVMTTSALLRHGPEYIGTLRTGLEAWLEQRALSLSGLRGLMSSSVTHLPAGFERHNYRAILSKWQLR